MKLLKQTALLSLLTASIAVAQTTPLTGFAYGKVDSPTGGEWESPEALALNKEQPRATFYSFQDVESARNVLPESSNYWLSLDGEWMFSWAPDPDSRPKEFYKTDYDVSGWDKIPVPSSWNIYGIQEDGELKYGVPIYCNQPVIFQHKVAVDDWRGGVMRTPPTDWVTYKHRNEVGSHRRDFTIPESWDGREVFVSFDGVDSFFYLWINGEYVGFSKNSRNAARFNITDYIQKGDNTIAVEVYRNSDGSFLEAQDMFRLPGIFRSVALYSTPQIHINDMVVIPDLDESYVDGRLNIEAKIANLSDKSAKGYSVEYSLFENRLYSDENQAVEDILISSSTIKLIEANSTESIKSTLELKSPNLWSAELPYRYTLVAELKDKRGRTIETISTYTGFREVEIRDTPASEDEFGLAGRYYYINGKTVKLKGVNRHETNPATGHVLSREEMEEEIMLMKRANINHVRNSHYPPNPYFYYLADKYGIYLEDEANIESHQYYYGEASLSHPKEWEAAHVARVMEMAHSTVNAPSIVIWSLGNEAGPGDNFITAYNALKAFDASRPVQYERNNSIVDMGSNQYPSIAWMQGAVKGEYNIKYPFHISEYAHSMGNACGNLVEYWEAIESTNFFCGGAIWDWRDQAMYNYTSDGTRYLAYGGDFGDNPNSGQFVMNGIIFAEMEPKPQYFEVKKVYQYIETTMVDVERGEIEIFNKNYFKDLSDYEVVWSLYSDGTKVEDGVLEIANTPARTRQNIILPYNYSTLSDQSEYMVKIEYRLKNASPWAESGYTQAEEQLFVREALSRPNIKDVATGSALKISTTKSGEISVSGENFEVVFDMAEGTINTLHYGEREVIAEGNGPRLDALRAFTNNDNWFYTSWFTNGLHNLRHKVLSSNILRKEETIMLALTIESQAPNGAVIQGGTSSGRNTIEELTDTPFGENDFKFTTTQIWTIYADGSIELQSSINSNRPNLILPRLGYVMKVDKEYQNYSYYGRGPVENYADRKSSQFIERFESTVADEFIAFPKPQEVANREDVRWCALTDSQTRGFAIVASSHLSVAALPYSSLDMICASHPHLLPEGDVTYLRVDAASTGLGGNSCGQGGPLLDDRVLAESTNFGFVIRPINDNIDEAVNISTSGVTPISATRNALGVVELHSQRDDVEVLYRMAGAKSATTYSEPFLLREGGVIEMWYRDLPTLKASATFGRIESAPVVVLSTSSEEVGEGNASHLVDGDPNSYWHTMYSVTVSKHPHWVDLDAGEMKMITGFTYLPRQGGGNGTVKGYTLHLSSDGVEWGEAVAKGNFPRGDKEQRVMLKSPIKARYIRFTALSEQSGQDFASGAELTILSKE